MSEGYVSNDYRETDWGEYNEYNDWLVAEQNDYDEECDEDFIEYIDELCDKLW